MISNHLPNSIFFKTKPSFIQHRIIILHFKLWFLEISSRGTCLHCIISKFMNTIYKCKRCALGKIRDPP